MLGIVITSILAVASVTTTTITGLALHQDIETADFVREWHKDAHLLWQQQHDLDAHLATDVLNLQHSFLVRRSSDCVSYKECVKM